MKQKKPVTFEVDENMVHFVRDGEEIAFLYKADAGEYFFWKDGNRWKYEKQEKVSLCGL